MLPFLSWSGKVSILVVAVDGSKHSEKIIDLSCDLAKKISASIVLMYVSTYPDLINEYIEIGGTSPHPKALQHVERAEQVMSKLAERIERYGIESKVVLETGDPAEKIVEKGIESKAEMIIVGLKGLHGVDRIRSMGSVARKIIETSPVPVLVVRGADL